MPENILGIPVEFRVGKDRLMVIQVLQQIRSLDDLKCVLRCELKKLCASDENLFPAFSSEGVVGGGHSVSLVGVDCRDPKAEQGLQRSTR